ncbi:peptidase, partial [Oleiphilus sp. HI0133]
GVGQQEGSFATPLGIHLVKDKFGYQLPTNTVFVGREPQVALFSPELEAENPDKDWILSRILWLSGCEPGLNRLGDVDTKTRYIYIHGTPDSQPMSIPASHGCIRMRTYDVAELFSHTPIYTQVIIKE